MPSFATTLTVGLGVVGAASHNLCWESSARGLGFQDSMSDESCMAMGIQDAKGGTCKDMNLWCIVNCGLSAQQHPVCADNDVLGGTGAPWCRAVPCKSNQGSHRWFAAAGNMPIKGAAEYSTHSPDELCTRICSHEPDSLVCEKSKKAVGSPWCLTSPPVAETTSVPVEKTPSTRQHSHEHKAAAGGKGAGKSPTKDKAPGGKGGGGTGKIEARLIPTDAPTSTPVAPPAAPDTPNTPPSLPFARRLAVKEVEATKLEFDADVDLTE